jgi:hypothetical protein
MNAIFGAMDLTSEEDEDGDMDALEKNLDWVKETILEKE